MSKPNPVWINANYEIRLVDRLGQVVTNLYPMRFRGQDLQLALTLMENRKWEALKDLSISPEIP